LIVPQCQGGNADRDKSDRRRDEGGCNWRFHEPYVGTTCAKKDNATLHLVVMFSKCTIQACDRKMRKSARSPGPSRTRCQCWELLGPPIGDNAYNNYELSLWAMGYGL
jgi:hypothetical protein